MNKATNLDPSKSPGDLVLKEVWRAKDVLSARYRHDLNRLFAETRKRERLSRHVFVKPLRRARKA